MFELAHPAAVPKDWQNLEVLAPKGLSQSDFNAMDWDAVPKLDYVSSQFRQLAIPEPARVIDSVHEFVMEDFGASQKVNSSKTMPVTEADAEAAPAQESATLEVHQSEISLEPPEPMGGDAVPAADLDMHAQDGDFLNCDEVPDLDPLVVEDLPAQESQALGEAEAPAPSALDSAALAQACEEAYQRGLQEGREVAQAEAQEALSQALAEAQAAAEQAQALALETQHKELSEKIQSELALLREVTQKLEAWTENPKQLFEPLKRLALHLAEQLVLAELNVSGAAIERLVQRCLDELNLHGSQVVTVELNAQDKARLQEIASDTLQNIQLLAVPGLQPASVRVIVNDTQVEDLVQHRLEALAHGLLGQPEAWREKSPFFRQPLAQRESEVQDVAQRTALPDTSSDEVIDA